MRCNRRLWFMKVTNFLLLTIVLTSLIVTITLMNRRPSLLLRYNNLAEFKSYYISNGANKAPGDFIKNYKVNNESFCTFNYNLPQRLVYGEQDLRYGPELARKSAYRVLYNVLEAKEHNNTASAPPITYATHVTPEFINFVAEIARRWEGAVSVAAFVPDDDANFIAKQLRQLCQCLPEMSRVSVHFIFPKAHPSFIEFQKEDDEIENCVLSDSSEYVTYRTNKKLAYPVNLARNVARNAVSTKFVMVSDVELMPSKQLAWKFIEMLFAASAGLERTQQFPARVFVVPVFEIERYEEIPSTKRQLLKLIHNEKALYFHRHVCSHCQKFPGLENWLQQTDGNKVKPMVAVKREYPFHRWEPIFIGTNDEPLYSEVLSWEGKQDKMTQMLEMCLRGYRFVILDNAFLVHWPGVKRKTAEMKMENKWRLPYILKNTRQYNLIATRLANTYKSKNSKCKLK